MNRILSLIISAFISVNCFGAALVGGEIPLPCEMPEKAWGVFQIPTLEANVPLYWSEIVSQKNIDKDNGADVTRNGNGYIILDHQGSEIQQNGGVWSDCGHWDLNLIPVGSMAFLYRGDEIYFYECTSVCLADWLGNTATYDGKAIRAHKNDIVCVCCAVPNDDSLVYVAYFDFVCTESDIMK